MIRPLSEQTVEEVMAEFDRVFGTLSISTEKPTAYREGEDTKESRSYILLPKDLLVADIRKTLGRSLAERYLLIVSYIYVRVLLNKKSEKKRLGTFLPMHNELLRDLGGERYRELVQHGLDEGHL